MKYKTPKDAMLGLDDPEAYAKWFDGWMDDGMAQYKERMEEPDEDYEEDE